MVAFGESFLIKRGGWDVDESFGMVGWLASSVLTVAEGDILLRLARGEPGWDGGR